MPKVIAEISARHIHLSAKDINKLFGVSYKLKKLKGLSQPGEFAAKETLLVKGPNDQMKIRIVGPARTKTQVELAASDCRRLGVEPKFCLSGHHENSAGGLTLRGPKGSVTLQSGVIVPLRHLHLSAVEAKKWHLKNNQKVSVRIGGGARRAVLQDVIVRIGNYSATVHLDTDEANAVGLLSCAKIDLVL